MWVKGVGVRRLAGGRRPANAHAPASAAMIFSAWGLSASALWNGPPGGRDRDAGPARQKMKMQMEDLLAARRFVELLEQKPLGLHAGHDRAPDLLHRRHEAREIFGVEVEERARRRLRNDQRMPVGARHHVHEGERHVVLVDLDAGRFAAKDLGEDVVGIIRRRQRILPCVRRLARAVAAAEGRVVLVMGDRALDRGALVSEIVGDRPGEPRVGELVRRIGEGRPIAARELVLALGAGLDPAQSAREREIDRLIVADLEMQERPVLDRAPVAAVERVVADEIDRAGDIAPGAARHHQEHAVGERRADQIEESAGEIGAAPFARARMHVELEERVPMLWSNCRAGQPFDRDVAVQRVAPLALDRLALARGERARGSRRKSRSRRRRNGTARRCGQKSGVGEPLGVLGGREGDVDRRRLGLLAQFAQAPRSAPRARPRARRPRRGAGVRSPA